MLKPADFVDQYANGAPQHKVDARVFGRIAAVEFVQPPGSYPDPATDSIMLTVPTRMIRKGSIDYGAGRIAFANMTSADLALSLPREAAAVEMDDHNSGVILALPATESLAALRDLNPAFSGHFGQLHSVLWRDNAIRDYALHVWRAAKGDRHAPDLDPDAALMKLALMLMKRADEKFTPKDLAYHLAPRARRDVTDFVEAHIEEDLPLFRLAQVAGLSPFHFARAFRLDMGDTPHQYVTRRRIAKARDMIRHTPLGLAEIALAAGFGSQSRMTTTFAREEGVTPGRLRREALI
jgi:AraC family transcriptional regulator